MSVQQTLTGQRQTYPYRSIVKDAYTTRDEGDDSDTRLEIVVWKVVKHKPDEPIKNDDGRLDYDKILRKLIDEEGLTQTEIAETTHADSYRDEQGGRSRSTVGRYYRGEASLNELLEKQDADHPILRVVRRRARSRDLGHFQQDQSRDDLSIDPDAEEPIDTTALESAFTGARSIASQNGFVFAPQSGTPIAVEDNERIDHDEIRRHDRPLGEVHAACMLEKPDGSVYEYQIDLDTGTLEPAGDNSIPPGGWS